MNTYTCSVENHNINQKLKEKFKFRQNKKEAGEGKLGFSTEKQHNQWHILDAVSTLHCDAINFPMCIIDHSYQLAAFPFSIRKKGHFI